MLHLFDPDTVTVNKYWGIAKEALELFQLLRDEFRQASVKQDGWHRKFLDSFPTFQKWQAVMSKCFELPGWDWTQIRDFLKLFPDLDNSI